jgi:hypothetical protein
MFVIIELRRSSLFIAERSATTSIPLPEEMIAKEQEYFTGKGRGGGRGLEICEK